MSAKAVNDFDTDEPAVIGTPPIPQAPAPQPATSNGKPLAVTSLHDGRILLFNDDCFNVLPHLKAGTVAMVFADLPYGTTACAWDSILPLPELWQQLHRIGHSNTSFIFTANGKFQYTLAYSNLKILKHTIIWDKVKPSSGLRAKLEPLRVFEEILVFNRGKCTYNPQMVPKKLRAEWKNDRNGEAFGDARIERYHNNNGLGYPKDIITISNANQRNRVHPTQKPVELLEYLIKTYSNPGDLVLDPTMGSGTTAVACARLGRRCIGIEMDRTHGYFETAVNRVKQGA